MLLSNLISIKKRYTRSINLERDSEIADSLTGYVPTTKCIEVLNKFINSYNSNNCIRSWTITGVYGCGKSAFSHYLSALCAPEGTTVKNDALNILRENENSQNLESFFQKNLPKTGLIRAIATAQREPVSHTILRALYRGIKIYLNPDNNKHSQQITDLFSNKKNNIIKKLEDLISKINNNELIESTQVISILKEVIQVCKTDIILIIDELGKNLEYTSRNQSLDDLFILQQIAELPSGKSNSKIFIIGILHQSFSDYLFNLNATQKNEWAKIQGRFEDISFLESSEQIISLIGKSISVNNHEKTILEQIEKWSFNWKETLKGNNSFKNIESDDLKSIYPLHPIAAVILPILCYKYAQNDRTLFTFLASNEQHSFMHFINDNDYNKNLPTLKLHHLYDYFIETAQVLISSRPNFQRWIEIQTRITDSKDLDIDSLAALKTIGILNLTSLAGSLKASREFVVSALCDNPVNKNEILKWNNCIDELINKGFITWRKQFDEIRIWEGSSFDIEKELSNQIESIKVSLAELLNQHFPLSPAIAQRHSYETGTLRYFERQFCDSQKELNKVKCNDNSSDGIICYWLGKEDNLTNINGETDNKKPIIVICASDFIDLKQACLELSALKVIQNDASELQLDGVARKEIRQRIFIATQTLEKSLENSFDFKRNKSIYFINGEKKINEANSLNSILSEVCDLTYNKGLKLWNELINRRELTAQGAKARKELIQAMLDYNSHENLSIKGYGPELSIYKSLLFETKIHSCKEGKWKFNSPSEASGVFEAWDVIEKFCLLSKSKPNKINEMYKILEAPPYGVKKGLLPVLLTAVLLKNEDKISIYQDDVFIPKLGMEHFELLFKNESKFSIKNVEINSQQKEILDKINMILGYDISKNQGKTRNITLLNTIKPLIRLVKILPQYSLKTSNLSKEAIGFRKAIIEAKEPDKLLFKEIPTALGFPELKDKDIEKFINKFKNTVEEIKNNYSKLLNTCKEMMLAELSFQNNQKPLKEELLKRSQGLLDKSSEPWLTRFLLAISDNDKDDQGWLESVVMVISDKPADCWSDYDLEEFKTKLTDISRRFLNFEAMQKEISKNNNGTNAKKITFTDSNGKEFHRILWLDDKKTKEAESLAEEIFRNIKNNNDKYFKQALLASLIDKIFESEVEKIH